MALAKRLAKSSARVSPAKRATKAPTKGIGHFVKPKPTTAKAPTPGHGSDQGMLPIGSKRVAPAKRATKVIGAKKRAY